MGCRKSHIQDWKHYLLHIIGAHNPQGNSMEMERNLNAGLTPLLVRAIVAQLKAWDDQEPVPNLILRLETWTRQYCDDGTFENVQLPKKLEKPLQIYNVESDEPTFCPDRKYIVPNDHKAPVQETAVGRARMSFVNKNRWVVE
jgi:hypothetical protein